VHSHQGHRSHSTQRPLPHCPHLTAQSGQLAMRHREHCVPSSGEKKEPHTRKGVSSCGSVHPLHWQRSGATDGPFLDEAPSTPWCAILHNSDGASTDWRPTQSLAGVGLRLAMQGSRCFVVQAIERRASEKSSLFRRGLVNEIASKKLSNGCARVSLDLYLWTESRRRNIRF